MGGSDAAVTILVAVFGAVAGYLAWAWQHRLRPWVAPDSFEEILLADDTVEIPPSLEQATMGSIFLPDVRAGTGKLRDVAEVLSKARDYEAKSAGSDAILNTWTEALAAAPDDRQVIEAIRMLLRDSGISDTVEMAIDFRKIDVPEPDGSLPILIRYKDAPDRKNGCFVLEFPTSTITFGEQFTRRPFAADRLRPLMELVAHADKQALVRTFEASSPILASEMKRAETVRRLALDVVQARARWSVGLAMTNFGATPFIVFPDLAKLTVKGIGVRPISLDCDLIRKAADGDWKPARSVQVLEPGTTHDLGIVTRQTQGEMELGHIVRAVYQSDSGEAAAQLMALGLASPRRQTLRTSWVPFRPTGERGGR